MHNPDLARDYIARAELRLRAVDTLFDGGGWADVVREAQEIVELALKALLRGCGVEAPRIHDVSDVLLLERARFPADVAGDVERLCEISKDLRRDRELAFYGAEDLVPSTFYTRADATRARDAARWTVARVRSAGI